MSQRSGFWFKDLLLLGTLASGLGLIAAGMLSPDRVPTPRTWRPDSPSESSLNQVVSQLDRIFQARWQDEQITPAASVTNLTFARRVSLALSGTIPSLEEIRKLEQVPEPQQRAWWMARVLEDRRTHDHLAERFARAMVGVEDGPFIFFRRHRFVDWLAQEIGRRTGYDQIVFQILADEGLWLDRPSVNYLTATINPDKDNQPDPIKLAAKTSRAFLGMRIDCLECHDDFLGTIHLGEPIDLRGGQQIDFHHFAAFFQESRTSLAGIRDRSTVEPYQFQLLEDDSPREIPPQVPYGNDWLIAEGPLRERLARWVTHPQNLPFARITVNRLWAIVFGQPIVNPIDDIPWGRPVPPELDLLAEDFIRHGYDLRRTLQIITAAKVFQVDSQHSDEITETHERTFAVFPLVRLRPEQMASSVIQATSLITIDASANVLNRVISFGQQTNFIQRFGDFGKDEFVSRGETVTQRLLMLNGQLIRERLQSGLLAASQIGGVAPDREKMAETMYLCCFTRYPTPAEVARFIASCEEHASERGQREAVLDYFWVLLNSAEFSWSH